MRSETAIGTSQRPVEVFAPPSTPAALTGDEREVLELLAIKPILSVPLSDPVFAALQSRALIEFDGLRYKVTVLGVAALR